MTQLGVQEVTDPEPGFGSNMDRICNRVPGLVIVTVTPELVKKILVLVLIKEHLRSPLRI
jgi:hypothetical protein